MTLAALPDHRLPADVEAAAYFVAAEALANAAKHAAASAITLSVAPRDGRLVIDIVDDGVGGARASVGRRPRRPLGSGRRPRRHPASRQ